MRKKIRAKREETRKREGIVYTSSVSTPTRAVSIINWSLPGRGVGTKKERDGRKRHRLLSKTIKSPFELSVWRTNFKWVEKTDNWSSVNLSIIWFFLSFLLYNTKLHFILVVCWCQSNVVLCWPVRTDKWLNCIQVFNKEGGYERQIGVKGTSPGHFRSPEGIAVDPKGLIYVCDTCNDRVQVGIH